VKTYTFASGSVSRGFVLTEDEKRGPTLTLGEYGPGSWAVWIPLNRIPENAPVINGNVVQDAFLLNASQNDQPFFVLSKDKSQSNGCCLIRFLTIGEGGKGNGYVDRITGFRSKRLAGGHGRNSGITPTNGTWSDEIWVVHERELVRVQLAGCETAFAVRVCNGEPTVEPWVEREPRQKPQSSDNGGGKHQWRTLKGSHVAPEPAWSPGIDAIEPEQTEFDAELEEMARATSGRRAGTKTCRPDQLVMA